MPLSIFRLRTLAAANIAALLSSASFFGFIFVGTLYMQQVLHYSALETGVAWLAASLSSIALAGLSQKLVTRRGAKIVMTIGMALIGAGVIWASQVPVHGHFLTNLAGPMIIAGAGTAFAFIPISIAALAGVAEHQAGLASGLMNTSRQLGGAIGIAHRLKRRHRPRQHLASRRQRTTRRSHQWLSAGAVGAWARSRCSPSQRSSRSSGTTSSSDPVAKTAIREAQTAAANTNLTHIDQPHTEEKDR